MKKHKHGSGEFHHKHSLGQNFIDDDALLDQLAEYALISSEDCVLEIGPGMGALTKPLALRAKQVVSLEIDPSLMPFLRVALEKYPNAEIVQGDVMKTDLSVLVKEKFGQDASLRVAANLPYYITTDVITKLIHELPQAKSIAVMIQKEVGDKLMNSPGEDGYGPLAILCQYTCIVRRALDVPAACFTPVPKVDSSFMLLIRRETPLCHVNDEALFLRLVKAAFVLRRKTLVNNLVSGMGLTREQAVSCVCRAEIEPSARAEALTIEQFGALSNAIAEIHP